MKLFLTVTAAIITAAAVIYGCYVANDRIGRWRYQSHEDGVKRAVDCKQHVMNLVVIYDRGFTMADVARTEAWVKNHTNARDEMSVSDYNACMAVKKVAKTPQ